VTTITPERRKGNHMRRKYTLHFSLALVALGLLMMLSGCESVQHLRAADQLVRSTDSLFKGVSQGVKDVSKEVSPSK
jgi:hypothetical protein